MARKSSKPKNPWLGKACQLLAVGVVLPRLFMSAKRTKAGINEFRLVVGSKTGSRINNYKIQFKKGAMAKYWKGCLFVPRGNLPLRVAPLALKPTSKEIDTAFRNAKKEFKDRPVSTERLECDAKVPVLVVKAGRGPGSSKTSKLKFGSLRLYRLPNTVGAKSLFIATFAGDGNPDGSGAGGSVHN